MRAALLSAALLFCACGPLVDARLPDVDICDDVQSFDVPATPFGAEQTFTQHGTWALPEDFRVKLSGQQVSGALTKVIFRGQGVADLSFLKAASVMATLDGHPTALEWDGTLDDTGAVLIRPEEPLDITALLEGARAELDTVATGALPTHPWTLTVRACFRVRARLSLSL
ncbi:MAG: hypothetical protein IRZ16_08700 [Myxococcaceae bacterium]|nr:hypothetical protein [Myxococcaceae bacterium]